MKHPKFILGGLLAIMLVMVALLATTPSRSVAQGLVEYALCRLDLGAPPNPEEVNYEELLATFGISEWPTNWGVFVSCEPKFDKDNIFNKLRLCGTAYEDTNSTGHLDFGDIRQMVVCTAIKQK